ncbi:MAG: hypothetical protein U0805_14380 [Pirellulales bacterium]
MFEIGTSELIALSILAAILFRRRIASAIIAAVRAIQAYREELEERRRRERQQGTSVDYVELITEQRDRGMTKHLKKFLWSPGFWATLGILGCTTGLYFQRVAANGSGLWCLGLIFLGAAYLEKNPY